MALAKSIIAQIRRLERALNQALLRLQDTSDVEALHDVRINLQRIRSLLRPLRGIPGVTGLSSAAADLGKITTPIRDLEVLIAELELHQLAWQANTRKTELHRRKLALMSQPLLTHFPTLLHIWPKTFRRTQPRHIKRRVALRLRLLVKRLRYVAEAYSQLSLITPETVASLKTAQSALGDWHDRFVWCQQAENQQDLWPLLPQWQMALETTREQAEKALLSLSRTLSA
ncbi:TPA: CHAD domain-containing protein [Serratia liquefaciens]|jgi:CHAD domain-containing protein|uniref:CHAD domain-containing protein n=1 Tax=Serratia liquefaciens TaxID=614 RepID=A0ABX7D472_SERLI|nr:CHAD domain-containing protein [Serratia liquefaciens]QQU55409.1 CHAD domain-containing protein [Serratia liquefaciens]